MDKSKTLVAPKKISTTRRLNAQIKLKYSEFCDPAQLLTIESQQTVETHDHSIIASLPTLENINYIHTISKSEDA